MAVATADPGLQVQAQAALEIRGLPAFRLEVVEPGRPGGSGREDVIQDRRDQPGLAAGQPGGNHCHRAAADARAQRQRALQADVSMASAVVFRRWTAGSRSRPSNYTIDVQAVQAGDVRFRAELRRLDAADAGDRGRKHEDLCPHRRTSSRGLGLHRWRRLRLDLQRRRLDRPAPPAPPPGLPPGSVPRLLRRLRPRASYPSSAPR